MRLTHLGNGSPQYCPRRTAPRPAPDRAVRPERPGQDEPAGGYLAADRRQELPRVKDAELIRRGCDFSVIEGAFETQDVEKSIRLTVGSRQSQRPGRTGKLNGADVGRAAALAGNFQAVVFEPDLLGLVKGGPDGRRRFLDSALCQVYRPYLVALRRYMRLTAQKNALLKSYDITPNGNMLLDTYDEQLAEYGALIMEHRCKFLAAAAPIAAQNYKDISPGAEVLALNYQMCTAAPHRRGADRKDAGHAQCRAARRVLPGRTAPRGSGNFAGRPARPGVWQSGPAAQLRAGNEAGRGDSGR